MNSIEGNNPGRNYVAEFLAKRALREKGQEAKLTPIKEKKKENLIFGEKTVLPMKEVERIYRKASPSIPGAGGAIYREQKRVELAQKITKKYGAYLEKKKREPERFIKDLQELKWQAETGKEKIDIDREIRFHKKQLFGK